MGLSTEGATTQVTDLMSRFGIVGYLVGAVVGFVLVRKLIHYFKGARKRKRGGKFLGLF